MLLISPYTIAQQQVTAGANAIANLTGRISLPPSINKSNSVASHCLNKFQQAGIDVIRGQATFIDPHTIEIDGRTVTADKIIVAVGGTSIKPSKILGIEYAITSSCRCPS